MIETDAVSSSSDVDPHDRLPKIGPFRLPRLSSSRFALTAPRIVFAGSVNTSRTALETIITNQSNLVGVLELAPEAARQVSGYARLDDLAAAAKVPSITFQKINDDAVLAAVAQWQPDLLFVVGLSQLVGEELLTLPKRGCVGFHPTLLPEGRGRAPIAWLALGESRGAATFFLMDAGADSGPILVQEPFDVAPEDYAFNIEESVNQAIRRGLNRWLRELNAGEWDPRPQDHAHATYLAKRAPADGLIDWQASANDVARLVRAASRPFPGAYTYAGGTRVIVWRASAVDRPIRGVVGRVVELDEHARPVVQAGRGLIALDELEVFGDGEAHVLLRVGAKLGYAVEDEVHRLRRRVTELESQVQRLLQNIESGAPKK
jgi:methionyl-tRNA formyltransferase